MDMGPQEQPRQQEEEAEEKAGLLGSQSRQHSKSPSSNGAEENEHNKSVYFETHQGIWKCRHCYWTYRPSLLLRGNGSTHDVSGMKYNASVSEASSTDGDLDLKTNKFEIQRIPSTETIHECEKHLENETLSCSSPATVQRLHDQNIKNFKDLQNTAEEDAEVDLIDEIDDEFTDLDLERVLQKQNTHDLYCPNCNSCITRKVVLRRRRRRVPNIRLKTKPENKLKKPSSELDPSLAYPANSQGPTPPAIDQNDGGQLNVSSNGTLCHPATDHNNDGQLNVSSNGTHTPPADDHSTEIFRCLSCFSLFIPTGNGSKLFRCLGGSDENVNLSDVQNISAPTKNWFFKIFSSGDAVILDIEPQPIEPQLVEPQVVQTHQFQTQPHQTHQVQTQPLQMHSVQIQPHQIQPLQNQPLQTDPVTQPVQTQPVHLQPVIPVEARNWDILKSIVYGGLVESITSLGVVSSAAGAGATTLNILALGLASVIGGLFMIAHNLREVKNDHSEESSNPMNEQEGRYQRLLGRRQNFSRHVIVVFLSFLIFGLVPPVVYGFSFRKRDDRDLKIAAVGGSSLACIVLLAVAKGHIQKPPRSYLRTVLYYASLGVTASGISYVVGDLFEKLMEKLGLFAPSTEVMIPFLEMDLMKPAWSSSY